MQKVIDNNYNLVGGVYRETKQQSNFKIVKLGEICNFIRGVTYKKTDVSNDVTHNIILRANNININNSFNYKNLIYLRDDFVIHSEKLLNNEDILICIASGSKNHLGKIAFVEFSKPHCYAGGFMGILRGKTNITSRYLYFMLCSKNWQNYITQKIVGTNINNLNKNILNNFKIPLPSIEQQQEIVNELDNHQKAIIEAEQVIDMHKKKINYRLDKLFN